VSISEFDWKRGSNQISWRYLGEKILKVYSSPPDAVCLLKDGEGVAVVESYRATGPRNGTILDCDGRERFRLALPMRSEFVHGYYDMYYISGELTAILATIHGDFKFVVDPSTGALGDVTESR
jgi:hypothetical protein